MYTWPAASVTNVTLSIPFVIRHMVSVLASETVSPNEAHIATISAIILARLFLDLETIPHRLHTAFPRSVSAPPVSWRISRPFSGLSRFFPPPLFSFTLVHTISFTAALTLNRSTTTRSTAVKKMFNSNGASTHPCRRPCHTEPVRTSAVTRPDARSHPIVELASNFGGTPNRASTVHSRVRSTESYAWVRSTKHMCRGVLFCAPVGEVVGPQISYRSSTVAV